MPKMSSPEGCAGDGAASPSVMFKPLPRALIARLAAQLDKLAEAKTRDEALAALFLLFCGCKDAEEAIREKQQENIEL